MPFQIYFDKIKELDRLAEQPQKLYIEFYHKGFDSPIRTQELNNGFDNFGLQYAFKLEVISDQPIYASVITLHPERFGQVIGEGIMDLQKLYQKKNSKQLKIKSVVHTNLYLNGSYGKQACLSIVIKYFDKKGQNYRFGLCKPSYQFQNIPKNKHNTHSNGKTWQNGQIKINPQQDEPHGRAFFAGNCESKNIFSMMDKSHKGQYFTVIQKQIKK